MPRFADTAGRTVTTTNVPHPGQEPS
jgi:hypothetical protein